MSYQPGETVKRVQKLLETLEEKKQEVLRAESDFKRSEIKREQELRRVELEHERAGEALKRAEENLAQVRKQFVVEIHKVDPGMREALRIPVAAAG